MEKSKKLIKIYLLGLLILFTITSLASAQYETYYALWGGVFLLYLLIWFIVWILVAIWVYKDAEKRGKSEVLWLLIVILLGLIGLIIWLLVSGEEPKGPPERRCPNCGRPIPKDTRICPYCGKKFEEFL